VNRSPICSEESKQIQIVTGKPNDGDVTITIQFVIADTCRM